MPTIISGSTGISGTDGTAATPAVQGTDTNTGIFFPADDTIAFAEGGTEVMRIDSAGNVGIGTASPAAPLMISRANTGVYSAIRLANITQSGSTPGARIEWSDTSTVKSSIEVNTWGSDYMAFRVGNNTERMRVHSDGTVSIGSTAVNALLTVDGGGPALTNQSFAFYAQSGNAPITGFVGGVNGIINSFWGAGRVSGLEFNARSDGRLKKNITPISASDAWHFVENVTPVHYKWNSGDDGHKFGFVAQDVVKAGFPNLVGQYADSNAEEVTDADGFTSPAGITLTVNYDQIVPILSAALRDALAQIEDLKSRVALLESK